MKLRVPKKIGKQSYLFEVEGDNLFDLIMQKQKLSFRGVDECGICGSQNLYIRAYITKEDSYEYVKVVCVKCKADLTFGRPKKEPDTFYLRKKDDGSLDWQKKDDALGRELKKQEKEIDLDKEPPF